MRKLRKLLKKGLLFLVLSSLAFGEAQAGEKIAKIYLDESTSMVPMVNYTIDHVKKLKELLEKKGFKVEILGFGENLRKLTSIKDYHPSQKDTNFNLVFDQLSNGDEENVLVFFVSDGRLPSSRAQELPKLISKAQELKDSGIFICSDSALKKPTKILTSLSAVVEPYGKEEELVNKCVSGFETLIKALSAKKVNSNNVQDTQKTQGQKETSPPLCVKNIDEAGFGNDEVRVNVKGGKGKGGVVINIYNKR